MMAAETMNDTQDAVLAILPKFSAALSVAGSTWILVEVASNRAKRRQVYHRLLASMAAYDVLVSLGKFASTWPIPVYHDNDVRYAVGNVTSCEVQGFLVQLGIGEWHKTWLLLMAS